MGSARAPPEAARGAQQSEHRTGEDGGEALPLCCPRRRLRSRIRAADYGGWQLGESEREGENAARRARASGRRPDLIEVLSGTQCRVR